MRGLSAGAIILVLLAAPSNAENGKAPLMLPLISEADALADALEAAALQSWDVKRALEELKREKCDQQAISNLSKALQRAGYRREAANALVDFSNRCQGHAPSLREAANILLKLTDFQTMIGVSSELIKLEPFQHNGYFLRAFAEEKTDKFNAAISDYSTAIELFPNKQVIGSVAYEGLARAYARIGRPCDAANAIDMWISANPARRDTSQSQAALRSYQSQGANCPKATGGTEVFPVTQVGQVIRVSATINGVKGNFILDTGATFVALTQRFATKAHIDLDRQSRVKLHTANGIVDAAIGRAKVVRLRSLEAGDIPVAVQDDAEGTYGDKVDGLLGMSFLSHFQVLINSKAVQLSGRTKS